MNIDDMVRQAKTDAENVLRSELGAARYQVMLDCAKRDTDTARNDVVQLSESVARCRELTRRRTLDHAKNIEESGKLMAAKHAYESQLERAQKTKTTLAAEVHTTQIESTRHNSLLERYSLELKESTAAEITAKQELLSSETKLSDVLSRLRTAHTALDVAETNNHQLISDIAALAEAAGSSKATIHNSIKLLDDSKQQDDQSNITHAESQQAVVICSTKLQTQEGVLASSETRLAELIAELRAQEHEVARQRDLTNKAAIELSESQNSERVASQVSLDCHRRVHIAEDTLAKANLDFDHIMSREKDLALKAEPSKIQLQNCSDSYNTLCSELESVKSEATVLQESAKQLSDFVLGMQTKLSAQQHVSDEILSALRMSEMNLTSTSDNIEIKKSEFENVIASLSVLTAAEQSTAVELEAVKAETQNASQMLLQAENSLRSKSAAERALSEAAIKALHDAELQPSVLPIPTYVVRPPPVTITSPTRLFS